MPESKPPLLQQIVALVVVSGSLATWKAVHSNMGENFFAMALGAILGVYSIVVAVRLFGGHGNARSSFNRWAVLLLIIHAVHEFSIEPVIWKAVLGTLLAALGLAVLGLGVRPTSTDSASASA